MLRWLVIRMLQFQRNVVTTTAIPISSSLLVLVQKGTNALPSSRQKTSLKDELTVVHYALQVSRLPTSTPHQKKRSYLLLHTFLHATLH